MSIGVVHLDEHLIARLQTHHGKGRFEIEHGERLFAGRRGARGSLAIMAVCPAIAPVRAIRVRFSVVEPERVTHPLGVTRRVPFAELPARTLAYDVVAGLGLVLRLTLSRRGVLSASS